MKNTEKFNDTVEVSYFVPAEVGFGSRKKTIVLPSLSSIIGLPFEKGDFKTPMMWRGTEKRVSGTRTVFITKNQDAILTDGKNKKIIFSPHPRHPGDTVEGWNSIAEKVRLFIDEGVFPEE